MSYRSEIMPIQYTDQLNLLKDILRNQQEDCCGSVSECEQIERTVKSLLINGQLPAEAVEILNDIYKYGQQGKNTQHLDTHIQNHQEQLSNWVNEIDQFS